MIPDTKSPAGPGSTAGLTQAPDELTNDHQGKRSEVRVNGPGQFLQFKDPSPLDLAKAIIPDILTLAEALDWPIEGTGLNYAWYRGNTNTPSLNIHEDGEVWFDFALGFGGGAIDLLKQVEDIDRRAACLRFIEISVVVQAAMSTAEKLRAYEAACGSESIEQKQARVTANKIRDEARKSEARSKWTKLYQLDEPTDQELGQIISIRRWPLSAGIGLRHAQNRGLLYVLHEGVNSSFVVTDRDRVSAKRRRLDGNPWPKGAKSLCLYGSENRWPIGTAAIRTGDHVILVEGETDQLAMICLLEMFDPEALAHTSVVSLSASTPIHPAAMVVICARAQAFTIIGDADDAGQDAAARWTQQLKREGFLNPLRNRSVHDVDPNSKDVSDLLTLLTNKPDIRASLRAWVGSLAAETEALTQP
jgi:hypothetical protein